MHFGGGEIHTMASAGSV